MADKELTSLTYAGSLADTGTADTGDLIYVVIDGNSRQVALGQYLPGLAQGARTVGNPTSQSFSIATDTGGNFVDTGPVTSGAILQIALNGANLDTGCDIKLELVNTGVIIADYDDIGGSVRKFAPRQASFDTGGAEIGDELIYMTDDRIRLTVNQGEADTGWKTATLYVWTGW